MTLSAHKQQIFLKLKQKIIGLGSCWVKVKFENRWKCLLHFDS